MRPLQCFAADLVPPSSVWGCALGVAVGGGLIAMATFVQIKMDLSALEEADHTEYKLGTGWALITASWISGLCGFAVAYGNRNL